MVERERAFLNMASHELRTPIAVIAGSAEVALDAPVDPSAVRPSLERILRTARDMERLVALLLALAKDPARLQAVAEPVALKVVVPDCTKTIVHTADPRKPRIVDDFLEHAQARGLHVDPTRPRHPHAGAGVGGPHAA